MNDPILIILAAGMGSRFGGLKQITAVDDNGHAILDYSLYDAYRAGFRKVCFVIKHEIEEDFKNFVGNRAEKYFDVSYVYQQLDVLPDGYSVPNGRTKPWGTAHAVLCCKDVIDSPFVVINADDFYGSSSYKVIFDFLTNSEDEREGAIVTYKLSNTVTEHGSVARGICSIENGYLTGATELTHIEKDGHNAKYTLDGEKYESLDGNTPVSMNFWGFKKSMISEFVNRFPAWLNNNLIDNPQKAEYFLPFVVNSAIEENSASFKVLSCDESWHGITYKEDMPAFVNTIRQMIDEGKYPRKMID